MAHVPEAPDLFVCADCYVVHAGIHGPEHEFRPPETCSVCGSDTFYELEDYPKHPDSE